MKALITGISGRVGPNLAKAMMRRGYEIRGLVMPDDPQAEKAARLGVELVEADIADAEAVRAALAGVDVVLHQAAQIPQGDSSAERMLDVNARATLSLLEGALASARPLRRFVFASTYQTYNPFVTSQVTFTEESPQEPIDIYALTKLLSEEICLSYMREYGLPVTILRYCSIKAANEVLGMLKPAWLNYFIALTLSRKRIPWFGAQHIEETQAIMRDLLRTPEAVCAVSDQAGNPWLLVVTDVRDVVAGTILALESEKAIGQAFNMTGAPPMPYPQAAAFARRCDRPPLPRGDHALLPRGAGIHGKSPRHAGL